MKKITLTLLLFSTIFMSCGTNDKNKLSDSEKELIDLLDNISYQGEGTHTLDSATAKRLSDLVNNVAGKWVEIKSEKGNFSIEFPDFGVREGQTKQLLDGEEITIHSYSINAQNIDHENLGYQITYAFMPDIKTKEQINEQFNTQRDYVLSAANAILEYEFIIDTLNYQGRDLYLTIDNSSIKTRYRMFFHNGIFYKLVVVTEEGKLFNNSIKKFLDSFRFLDDSN